MSHVSFTDKVQYICALYTSWSQCDICILCTLSKRTLCLVALQVSVPDAQLEKLDALEGSWAAFRSCLDETAANLERAKDSFRDKLVQMVDTFSTDVVVSRDMFTQDAPYSNEVRAGTGMLASTAEWYQLIACCSMLPLLRTIQPSFHFLVGRRVGAAILCYFVALKVSCVACLQNNDVAAAMRFINAAKAELAAQRQKASELKSGMDIFNISQPAYKELSQNEKVHLPFSTLAVELQPTSFVLHCQHANWLKLPLLMLRRKQAALKARLHAILQL